MKLLSIPLALALAVAFLVSGCALGHTMKTVETAPKGEICGSGGLAIWFADGEAFHEDPLSVVQTNPPAQVVPGLIFHARYGVAENAEAGFSLDGIMLPGVGGKIRLNEWSAIDANVKMFWLVEPYFNPVFDAALIFGNATHSYGLKLLSHGAMPGSIYRSDPDAVLFYGFRRSLMRPEGSRRMFLHPEVAFMTRHREISLGLGFVF